jgi:hypothetical protein
MAGGGGKGGSQSTSVEIPAWLEQAAQSGLARGTQAAGIGYVPYRGPDVAALTPLQEAAMANTSAASSAFGLGASPMTGAGMPAAQTFAGGVRGYSSAPLYDQAVSELQMRDPAQYAKLMAPFDGNGQFGITSMPMGQPQSYGQPMRDPNEPRQGSASSRNTKFDTYSTKADTAARAKSAGPPTRQQAGYSGVKDMFDGGGPRASGAKRGRK